MTCWRRTMCEEKRFSSCAAQERLNMTEPAKAGTGGTDTMTPQFEIPPARTSERQASPVRLSTELILTEPTGDGTEYWRHAANLCRGYAVRGGHPNLTEASQQGRSAGGQGTGPSSDPRDRRENADRFTSPRPGTSVKPASRPSPTRPAPQSQSLFRSYGSNLPTSLTYIDAQGIIRVGGRLNQSALAQDSKHQAILPRHSRLSTLIISHAHLRTLHGGTQLTLAHVRQSYWIIGGRAPVKSHILRCVVCARQGGIRAHQLMGQLPLSQVTPSRPFTPTGVDYAGPLTIKTLERTRCKNIQGMDLCVRLLLHLRNSPRSSQ
ncbi:uncharacterized protein LOC143907586 isoform X1 [Temnothorax americanus]|uniref:uncharacterized protein LOC143907586 isoform X1 n=1 Tax=Temnothorax americanus TaxID=1964332 RepID=UPI004067D9CD